MELQKIVLHAFESIIKKYSMQSSIISENEVVLFTDKYILSFLRHSGELEMVYVEKNKGGALYQYNIDSFIANSILEEDRMRIKEYKSFLLYIPVRNVTQLKGEVYRGKCL